MSNIGPNRAYQLFDTTGEDQLFHGQSEPRDPLALGMEAQRSQFLRCLSRVWGDHWIGSVSRFD